MAMVAKMVVPCEEVPNIKKLIDYHLVSFKVHSGASNYLNYPCVQIDIHWMKHGFVYRMISSEGL